jgi:hypothetical protein
LGVAAGAGVSVWMAVHSVSRMGKASLGQSPPPASAPDDDED